MRMGPALWELDRVGDPARRAGRAASSSVVIKEEKIPLNDAERDQLVGEIIDQALGYGPIERYLARPDGHRGHGQRTRRRLHRARRQARAHRRAVLLRGSTCCRVIDRIVAPVGRRIDESSPMVDARLPDGSRVNAIIPPLAIDGPLLTIRKFAPARADARRPRRLGTLTDRGRRLPRRVRRGPAEHPRQRRHRHRQDDAAQRAVVDDPRQRAHRHHRGRRRAAAPAAPRDPAREPARRTSRARARSRPATWSATRCACGPTASSSARSAAPRRSTCCRP